MVTLSIAEQIVANSACMYDDSTDINQVIELSEEQCTDYDQVWEQEKTFFYFVDNSGLVVNNNSVETF